MRTASLAVGTVVVILLLVAAGAAFGRNSAAPKLNGTVGPGYTIKLTKSGQKVKVVKAGSYLFVVADKSSFHNFTIEREKGGKFEKHLTTTPFTGVKSVTIKLGKGTWKFYCSIHESQMHGFFTVN
jgi:plastocyanin